MTDLERWLVDKIKPRYHLDDEDALELLKTWRSDTKEEKLKLEEYRSDKS